MIPPFVTCPAVHSAARHEACHDRVWAAMGDRAGGELRPGRAERVAGFLCAGEEDRTPMQTLPRRYPGRSPSLETRFPTGPLLVCSVLLQPCGRGFLQSARVTGRRCLRFRRASPFRPHPLDTHLKSTSCATRGGLQVRGDSMRRLVTHYPAGYWESDAYRDRGHREGGSVRVMQGGIEDIRPRRGETSPGRRDRGATRVKGSTIWE